ncbi:hypothetical protein M23134_01789 [Microscilla marina ATCC 23134]|uniref:Uncharacterized protein n=1 Tax=Microscilla marina ATCC 23134 TaxID=313606 RepID=A1ZZK6_MICM2|nr:hypothetical protein M23134_01789 [Microscilla marina ATCC 23134]
MLSAASQRLLYKFPRFYSTYFLFFANMINLADSLELVVTKA